MRIREFAYYAASSLTDALEKLDQSGPEAVLLAGGTDLILALKEKKIRPDLVISLHRLKEMASVEANGSSVRIGALTRHADLADRQMIRESIPVLSQAVGSIGSWQIRNMGTIGGNICHASPAADSAPALLVLDARVVLADVKGETEMPIDRFFTGPGETAAQPNQILKEILLRIPGDDSAGMFLKLMRRKAVDLSIVNTAFQAEVDSTGSLSRVAIALGGVAPTPIRATEAEAVLTGLPLNQALKKLPEAAKAAVDAARPIDDIRASAAYRKSIIGVFVHRAGETVLQTLLEKMRGQ